LLTYFFCFLGYRVVATRGSIIYFVVANLALVDPMYQYSLQYYKDLFTSRLQKTEKKEKLEDRLALLIEDITLSIYLNVCRGLFEKDKLLFSFMMSVNIALAAEKLSEKEWQMFMVGAVIDSHLMESSYPTPEAFDIYSIPDRIWQNVVTLELEYGKGSVFEGLMDDVQTHTASWVDLFNSENPYERKFPAKWEEKLSEFQRLLFIRFIREEKVIFAIRRYVSKTLNDFFIESPPFDLNGAYSDSTNTTPLIFILSPGADPIDYLLQLAESKGKEGGGLRIISLGQGQGPIAERAIEQAQRNGMSPVFPFFLLLTLLHSPCLSSFSLLSSFR
jgi:dynein heavy chain